METKRRKNEKDEQDLDYFDAEEDGEAEINTAPVTSEGKGFAD